MLTPFLSTSSLFNNFFSKIQVHYLHGETTQKKRGLVLCHNDVRKDWVHVLHVHLYGLSSKGDQGSEPLHMVDQLSCRVCRVYMCVVNSFCVASNP